MAQVPSVSSRRSKGKQTELPLTRKSPQKNRKRGRANLYSDEEEFENINLNSAFEHPPVLKSTYTSNFAEFTTPSAETMKHPEIKLDLPPNHPDFPEDNEIEQELDLFRKTIHISNIDEIDHVGLMRGMHDRFQRKQMKWQRYSSAYSKWAFGINFLILVSQVILMLFHQLVEVFAIDSASKKDDDDDNKFSLPRGGLFRRNGASVSDISPFSVLVFNASTLQALRCVLAAGTAVLAGLQMKLKLIEKSEKYRRGAKTYSKLHRISTYYLMLAENGGKVEDVTGLWREALNKEGKWIPIVKSYMTT